MTLIDRLDTWWRVNGVLRQWRPKAPPATQNASQKSLGDKNKEVKEGQNLHFCFNKGKISAD